MWWNSCIGEFILIYLAHTVYICFFFRFDTSPKNLFVSCNYHVLFVCVAHMIFMVNTADIQYSWIFLDIQIMQDPLCTAVLTILFFRDYSNQKYGLFFSFVGLMLWLKVCVAFTDLQNLTIVLYECKMSFKMGNLRCAKYVEKKWTYYSRCPHPYLGGQHSVSNFEKRLEKISAWWD